MQDTKEFFNNRLKTTGVATGRPTYTHTVKTLKGEVRYCSFELKTRRLSGAYDYMNISIKEDLIKDIDFSESIELTGEVRTTNIETHLKIYVFATEIKNCYNLKEDINYFEATVYTCKKPNYRQAPAGKYITDLTLACIRSYKNRSDYFPAIAWGQQAKEANKLAIGEKLYIRGRLQSRAYTKVTDGVSIDKIAYEVSIRDFELLD